MTFSELIQYANNAKIDFSYCLPSGQDAENIAVQHFCTDSRQVQEGSLFVCIQGEKSDGHSFAKACIEQGAKALIADKKLEKEIEESVAVLYVENASQALQKLAHAKREEFKGKVIAITGTSGKTSVKEMLFQVLAQKSKAAKNHLNFNTQIGVSLSILNTDNDEDFWILEAGISHEHDMDEIAAILTPDIALVLNVGLAHAEGLPKGAAFYKTKLFSYLKKNDNIKNQAFASADYPELYEQAHKNYSQTLFYSICDEQSPYFAKYIGLDSNGMGRFLLKLDTDIFEINAPLRSDYGAENCIAIACIASLFMTKDQIIKAFKLTTSPKQRFDLSYFGNIVLIDDCYNANPLSFKRMITASLEYCKEESIRTKPLICLVGSMAELGEIAEKEHEILAKELALAKVEKIYYTGSYASSFEKGLKDSHFDGHYALLSTPEAFYEEIKAMQLTNHVFLVKGSRSNHLENYSQKIREIYG